MRRREFITSFGSSVVAWPLTARAQQAAMPVIGFLQSGSPSPNAHLVAAFRQGLSESGYVEGRNVAIEFRSADNQRDRLPALVADLLGRPVSVIAGDNSAAPGHGRPSFTHRSRTAICRSVSFPRGGMRGSSW